MRPPLEGTLEYEIRIEAPVEAVFRHFTDPRLFIGWIGRHAMLDPRPGGAWSLDLNGLDVVAVTFPPDIAAGHDEGWRHYLARLAISAAGRDPGPDSLGTTATRHNPLRGSAA